MSHKHTHACPVAAALNIFGDHWTLLIVREALYGARRFGEFQRNTGISKNLLADRLTKLVDEGILQRVSFADRGTSFAYSLTDKGQDLKMVLIAMQQWADQHVFGEEAAPVNLVEAGTGARVGPLAVLSAKGKPLDMDDIRFTTGPGADKRTHRRLAEAKAALQNR